MFSSYVNKHVTNYLDHNHAILSQSMHKLLEQPILASYRNFTKLKYLGYFQKLIAVEERYNRHLIVEEDIVWTPKKYKASDYAQIKLQSAKWNPRLPIKSAQKWDDSSRELTHVSIT